MGYGPVKGTLAICLITLAAWSLAAALTYMFAVLYNKYNYKSIMQELLGPISIAYEICYIYLLVIIMADVGAGWLKGGFMYAFYNMCVLLGTVYTVRRNGKNYKSAGVAGIIAGFYRNYSGNNSLRCNVCLLPGDQ